MNIDPDHWIAAATGLLQGRSEGQALCGFAKAGTAVPGMKYAEGRWAALREVQREQRAGGAIEVAATRVAQSWTSHLELLERRGGGADWIAYRRGGVDVLAELIAEIGTAKSNDHQ